MEEITMENKRPISEVIGVTMEKVREMVDANTVVGQPIHTPEGVTIIPISKISFGFGSAGSDFSTKNQPADKENAFGGGAAAGVNIDPVGFLIVKNDCVRLLPACPGPGGPVERVIDLMPELVDKVTTYIDKKTAEKKGEKKPSDSENVNPES
jgi:sporulation protein YtfJ